MRKTILFCLVSFIACTVQAANVKIYPGAQIDPKVMKIFEQVKTKASPEDKAALGDTTVYTTKDAYQLVYGFYKKLYKETDLKIKQTNKPLANGKLLNDAYFCLDGQASIAFSKFWLKIQNPYVGQMNKVNGKLEYSDIKDLTVITLVEKK